MRNKADMCLYEKDTGKVPLECLKGSYHMNLRNKHSICMLQPCRAWSWTKYNNTCADPVLLFLNYGNLYKIVFKLRKAICVRNSTMTQVFCLFVCLFLVLFCFVFFSFLFFSFLFVLFVFGFLFCFVLFCFVFNRTSASSFIDQSYV